MELEKPLAKRPIVLDTQSSPIRRMLPGAALGAVFFALAALIGVRTMPPEITAAISGFVGVPIDRPDNLSAQTRANLTAEFLAHGPVELRRVRLSELDTAIANMALKPAQETALRADIALVLRASRNPAAEKAAALVESARSDNASKAPPDALQAEAADSAASVSPQNTPQRTTPISAPAPKPAAVASSAVSRPAARPSIPAPVAQAAPEDDIELPLAWLTLWDHRDEDGDIVRVVSEGYSRTVPILNTPVTLAVPVPASGVVNVIGIHDGMGGITVGIQSGATPVLLPVLSVGQVVGVPIAVK